MTDYDTVMMHRVHQLHIPLPSLTILLSFAFITYNAFCSSLASLVLFIAHRPIIQIQAYYMKRAVVVYIYTDTIIDSRL